MSFSFIMKKEFQLLALGLILVVIVSLLFGSTGVEPYSKSDMFSKEYVYEGLEEDPEKKQEILIPPAEGMENEDEEKKPESLTMFSDIAKVFGKKEGMEEEEKEGMEDEEKIETMFGLDQAYASVQGMFKLPGSAAKSDKKEKKEGFSLSPAAYGGQQVFDKFSSFAEASVAHAGGPSCVSGGLATSRGPLCLSPELMEILRTRGGNATGK